MSDEQRHLNLPEERRDLDGGLTLRRASSEDVEAVARFNAKIHYSTGGDFEQREAHEGVAASTRDLMGGAHPTCDATDFTLVEDVRTGTVVSSACLIPQRFSYEGIEFGAGVPELVGTHPDFRRHGLVRRQFEVLHRWSAERGHLMQAIGGIPYYYRQFGYEMAVSLDAGRRMYASDVKNHEGGREGEGKGQSYWVRPAEASDAQFLSGVHRRARERYLLTCPRDERLWRYELVGRDPKGDETMEIKIVEGKQGEPIGYLCLARDLEEGSLQVYGYELVGDVSWLEVTPTVLEELKKVGQERAAEGERLASLTFLLGEQHPLYEVIPKPPLYRLDRHDHYSFYVRVPDLPALVREITPVLERRLAGSVAAGHTGDLKASFYGDGLYLKLERGRLSVVERWEPEEDDRGAAAFPDLTFLQLLFGHRSLEELEGAFADCSPGSADARVLLRALFPRRPSDLWPVF